MRRFWLICCLICNILCVPTNADRSSDERLTGEWYWTLHPDGYAVIIGSIYNAGSWGAHESQPYIDNPEEPWIIPAEIDGYPVKELASASFLVGNLPKNIVLPEGLTTIRQSAFCEGMIETISIPSTVSVIEDGAFDECSYLKRIQLSECNPYFKLIDGILVSSDGKDLIAYPAAMSPGAILVIPDGVERVHAHAFSRAGIHEVIFPESLTMICDEAFLTCYSLSRVVIPSNVQSIGSDAFLHMFGTVTFESLPTSMGKSVFNAECVEFNFNFLPDADVSVRFSCEKAMDDFFQTGELEPSMLQTKPDPVLEQPVEEPSQDAQQIPPQPPKEEQASPIQPIKPTPPQDPAAAANHAPAGWYVLGTLVLLSIGAGAYLTVRKGRKH